MQWHSQRSTSPVRMCENQQGEFDVVHVRRMRRLESWIGTRQAVLKNSNTLSQKIDLQSKLVWARQKK